MKRLLPTLLFLILTAPLCFSMEDFHFSVAPRFSFTYGKLTELLYDSYGSEIIVSQLEWEQKPLFNLGIEADISFKNLIINSIFDFSVPIETSYMYDSDDFNGDYIFDKCSKHPIGKTTNLNTELTIMYKLPVSYIITVFPLLNFQYLYNDFEAEEGQILFGQKTKGKKVKAGKIDYLRHSVFLFLGVSTEISPLNKLSLGLDFLISPWGYQYSYNYHHGSGNNPLYPFSYYDYIKSFFSKVKINLTSNFSVTNNLKFQLFSNFLLGLPDKGEEYTDYASNELYLSSQKAGANIYSLKAGTAVIFNF